MFNQGGLSLEQAPPISVVLRFFVTGAVFGLVGGILLLFYGESVFDPATQQAKILTHTLALGVMASFMIGALFQMLPVIAGVVLQTPAKKAMFVHVGFVLGVISLLSAFYTQNRSFFLIATLFLGITLLYTIGIMIYNLFKLKNHSSSSKGMLFALLGFGITVLMAIYMTTTLGGIHEGSSFFTAKEIHYSFGLFGWIALLIISISFQVVEMFYVTPAYPKYIASYLVPFIFILLVIKSLFLNSYASYIDIFIALLLIIYAFITIHRLYKRKRPTSDATVWLWRFGMGVLIFSMIFFISGVFIDNIILHKLSYICFAYFALSVIFAMTYKIVPFLVWFHLSNQGYMKAPLMHDIVHPKKVKTHFYIHVFSFILWLFSFISPIFFVLASCVVILLFGWVLYHLLFAVYTYRHTQKHSEKISW